VLVSGKRPGKALLSFHFPEDAVSVASPTSIPFDQGFLTHLHTLTHPHIHSLTHTQEHAVQSAHGLAENPLTVTWVCGRPRAPSPSVRGEEGEGLMRDSDYESLTLMRLRQAEERKRLCQQLAQEDLNS